MFLYTHGFWTGFYDKTDGVHIDFFISLLTSVFDTDIQITHDINNADILLETHFGDSAFFRKEWTYSIFFSGEGSLPLPSHSDRYTWVMGAQATPNNFISCPLYLAYDFCKPFEYVEHQTVCPERSVCSVISSPVDHRIRGMVLDLLRSHGISVDNAGRRGNTIGYSIPGQYYESPILDFYKQYKLVCAFENTIMDDYITEKIVNVFRAGTIPIYLGSAKIAEYFNPERFVCVTVDTLDSAIAEIRLLLSDNDAWLKKINQPIFRRSTSEVMRSIVDAMKTHPSLKKTSD